jgi:hypothetical protein
LRFLLDLRKRPGFGDRVTRFYYYSLKPGDPFDTALLNRDESPRPFCTIYRRLTNPDRKLTNPSLPDPPPEGC